MEKKERSFYEILIFIFINVIVFSVAMLIDNSDLAVTILGLLMPFNVAYWLMIYVFNNYKNKKEIVYDEEIDDDEMRDIYHEAGHVVIQLLTETPKKAYIRSVSIIREQYTDICYKSCSESKENLDQLLSFYMGGFVQKKSFMDFLIQVAMKINMIGIILLILLQLLLKNMVTKIEQLLIILMS